MVQLSSEAAKKYVMFEDYLEKQFVHVLSKSRVMKAFWKWSDFSESWLVERYFRYGNPPTISIQHKSPFGCTYSEDGEVVGVRWAMTFSEQGIHIWGGLVGSVEDAHIRGRAGKSRNSDRLIFDVIEATIVHEMVHWSYYVNDPKGAKQDKEGKKYGGDEEYGTRNFEREAYGHIASIDWHLLCFEHAKIPPNMGAKLKTVDKTCKVDEVTPYSPADYAGLKEGDVIVKFDGQQISSKEDVDAQLRRKMPGDQVSIEVRRNDKVITLRIVFPIDINREARERFEKQ